MYHTLVALCFLAVINVLYYLLSSSPFWEILDVLGLYGGFLYARFGDKLPTKFFSNRTTYFALLVFMLTYIVWLMYQDKMMFRYSFVLMLLYDMAALLAVIGLSRNVQVRGRYTIIISKLSVLSYFIYLVHMKVIDVLYTVYYLDNILISIATTMFVACFVQFIYNCIQDNIVKRQI